MKTLTFALDVELNEREDWIAKGTKVQISDGDFHLKRFKDSIPVIITNAYNYKGMIFKIDPYVEWFTSRSFEELR